MNGRIHDSLLGRFLSADREVQYPDNLQSYNRYSYVRNNPLTLTDPSGFDDGPPPFMVPIWLGYAQCRTPQDVARLNGEQRTISRETAAGSAGAAISQVTGMVAAASPNAGAPPGIPGMGGTPITSPEQFKEFQEIQAAGQGICAGLNQGGRDLVTAASGIADDNEGRRGAEVAADVAFAAAALPTAFEWGMTRLTGC
jgi:hypothetical protein